MSLLFVLVCVIGDAGGRTLDEATKRMTAVLMTNDLSLNYSFCGRHGKRESGTVPLFEVLYRAIKRNAATNGSNWKEAERAVAKWLSGGRDRGGNSGIRAQHDLEKQPARAES
ncbi:UNVERIFIED_CONTAM: hypothetical protein FKN15_035434 [Acipenser sinensis]